MFSLSTKLKNIVLRKMLAGKILLLFLKGWILNVQSCSFLVANFQLPRSESQEFSHINHYLKLRGPDYTNIETHHNITFVHNLLSMTGKFNPQPFVSREKDIVILFNGEIYNYKDFGHFESDGDCLLPLYEKFGESFFGHLDGEFAIVVFDFSKQLVLVSSDVFGTKPLWFAHEKHRFCISSYKSALVRLKFLESSIKHFRANTITRYHCTV